MNEYAIYWIEENVAKNYFHKSDLLHRFFLECAEKKDEIIIRKQFRYITRKIHFYKFAMHLKTFSSPDINVKRIGNRVLVKKGEEALCLYIENGELILKCNHLVTAMSLLFPVLEDIHPYFFVQGKDTSQYGWISPKPIKAQEDESQVLYNFL
ncbi:sporulation inhibitor of replication protein SirA [Oceanobacillus jeddahense]|uniref:Sporulation inhibitor of replication protein SirA n=1 Tax=Oceanobacillus jeddahense TaxID=1462527 RepID=A0ABY5JN90_9BACI|nr:sporulation inhibitor of replication protein SirA [Oceanobacillus jeddahense]UUI01285.1 sporulation inhibitor of replication protein SirA [Oceanobacillus jeddahense]